MAVQGQRPFCRQQLNTGYFVESPGHMTVLPTAAWHRVFARADLAGAQPSAHPHMGLPLKIACNRSLRRAE
ncbi:hypothetical protein CHLRE_06g283975v5 [Chlamydomonas reinhardtii]|uniref:Uncharacterized protein n=1 Tax=Chlamydomonas reinhardtii TaxID=3055 RepID=A0A2K3DPU4_CHLRE|nr:uncharacterized protein CHLRE_06g283975v5 [Chlamydomonas reinhardtii]PNW82561.1 hypothetical protein CHLRE_06g283975v5 [Chlamydomonas reinhardtii]